jgi:hypothetical protein
MKVVPLPVEVPHEPDPNVVQELEFWLDLAKKGEVRGFVLAGRTPNGTLYARCGELSRAVVGRLFSLAMQISDRLDRLEE